MISDDITPTVPAQEPEAPPAPVIERQDIEAMTYADKAFDTIVCFRLFHHFPDRAIRARTHQRSVRGDPMTAEN